MPLHVHALADFTSRLHPFHQHLPGKQAVLRTTHWQTFLAALELKIITGKKMVLQVHTLSQTRQFPDHLGWMQAFEKQAFQKADAILLDNERLAADLQLLVIHYRN